MIKNYSYRTQVMHFLLAIMILGLMVIGMCLSFLPNWAYAWHKSFGLLVLLLMVFRIYFILKDGRPRLPHSIAFWERFLARGVQYSFYILLLVMPLAGWIMSTAAGYIPSMFGLFSLPFPGIEKNKLIADFFSNVHYLLAWVIGACIILHLLGNIKHYFIDKDGVVQKMWNFKKR